jgi:uncharacterized protein (TIGR02246 family)
MRARGTILILLSAVLLDAVGADATDLAHVIRDHFTAFARACERGDVPAVLDLYDKSARVVWPGEPEEARGRDELAQLVAEACRPDRAVTIELESIEVRPLGAEYATAVLHGEYGMRAPDGHLVSFRIRATQVLVHREGGWRILVDHASVGLPPPRPRALP